MNGITSEEVKRQAIKFAEYVTSYYLIYDKQFDDAVESPAMIKTSEELYTEFTENKPVSLT